VFGDWYLDIVGLTLLIAFATVGVQLTFASWAFGRVLKTARPDLFKLGGAVAARTFWAFYSMPQRNPALERPRKRIITAFKWFGLVICMWILFGIMLLTFTVLRHRW
jgi:hypothetical protein